MSHPVPHPLFALPLCPRTAQMSSALSSHPVDFCGLLTPPYFVPNTPTPPFLPPLVCDSEYSLTSAYNAVIPLLEMSHHPPGLVTFGPYMKKKTTQIHYHRHGQLFSATHDPRSLSCDLTSCGALWVVHLLKALSSTLPRHRTKHTFA